MHWITLVVGASIAVVTVALQLLLKLISREPGPLRRHALAREDGIWWIDWIVSGSISLAVSVLVASKLGKPVPIFQMSMSVATLVVGLSAYPVGMKYFLYDRFGDLKGWKPIAASNFGGLMILLGTVSAGASSVG